jgi:hypothetical protein
VKPQAKLQACCLLHFGYPEGRFVQGFFDLERSGIVAGNLRELDQFADIGIGAGICFSR